VSIRKLLQGGDRRSKGRSDALAADAVRDPGLVAELVGALLDEDEIVRLRAADALEKASAELPEILAPHAAAVLGPVADLEQHDVRWHVAQMVPRLVLDEAGLKRAVSVLTATLAGKSVVARVMAMDALVELAERTPPLRRRAARAVERAQSVGTPAERARARQIVKRRGWLASASRGPSAARTTGGSGPGGAQ
jgi:HEAT repeat protein